MCLKPNIVRSTYDDSLHYILIDHSRVRIRTVAINFHIKAKEIANKVANIKKQKMHKSDEFPSGGVGMEGEWREMSRP
jgi:hypothetical protein